MEDVRNGTYGTSGVLDLHGKPTAEVTAARGLTLSACELNCGTEHARFEWFTFSQEFSSWLLPWLALSSQLPFGATSRLDNAFALLLAMGSPALAVFSLSLTLLQRRWISQRFSDMSTVFPNAYRIKRVVLAFEQLNVRLAESGPGSDGLLESLVALPENDEWWAWLSNRVDSLPMWTIPAAVSIFWVVLALAFTLVDSIASPVVDVHNHGHAVGSVWLWLIPVVAGWLQAGFESHPSRIAREVEHINESAFVAPAQLDFQGRDDPVPARDLGVYRALRIDTRQRHDAECPAPIFAYARVFKNSAQAEHIALMCDRVCDRLQAHIPAAFGRRQFTGGPAAASNRHGTASEVIRFCASGRESVWAPGIWRRIAYAAAAAVFMQWTTTGAAIAITYLTPTIGLGCRSGSFLIYGAVATIAWIVMLLSSILSHAASAEIGRTRAILAFIAESLRLTGKVLAAANAVWLVTLCIFQFSGFYSTCSCMSGAWSLGKDAYVMFVSWPELIELGTRTVWIVGIVAAGISAALYAAFIYFALSPDE